MSERTLVLNSSYNAIGLIDWKRAITLLYENSAETIIEWNNDVQATVALEYDKTVSNYDRSYVYRIPAVIRLLRNDVRPSRGMVKFSKLNVFYRDNFTCQYCGHKKKKDDDNPKNFLTLDHVVPRAAGGKTNFKNCVAACHPCNSKKGDMLLKDSGMKIKREPRIPDPQVIMKRKLGRKKTHVMWKNYLHYDMDLR